MINSEIICDAELISRYMDNELNVDELASVKTHIAGCESCRTRLREYAEINAGLNSFVQAQQGIPAGQLENRVLGAIGRKTSRKIKGWKNLILSKRVLVPVGVAAAAVVIFFTNFDNRSPIGPTAIVSSLSGTGSSVMILETAKTRQTILWFSENG